MQGEALPDEEPLNSFCPKCGTRMISGKILIGGLLICAKCRRLWLVDMDDSQVLIKKAPVT